MTTNDPTNQELDLDKEYGNNNGGVPTFLMVLIVLTSINVVFNLYQAIKDLFVSAESTANIEAEFYSAIDQSGVEMQEMPEWIMEGMMEFIEKLTANAVLIRVTDLVYYALLGVAAFLMYRLKMVGFYLYVVVNILGVLVTPALYGFNFIGIGMAVLYAIVAVVFIAMYSANRKHLS